MMNDCVLNWRYSEVSDCFIDFNHRFILSDISEPFGPFEEFVQVSHIIIKSHWHFNIQITTTLFFHCQGFQMHWAEYSGIYYRRSKQNRIDWNAKNVWKLNLNEARNPFSMQKNHYQEKYWAYFIDWAHHSHSTFVGKLTYFDINIIKACHLFIFLYLSWFYFLIQFVRFEIDSFI